MAEETKTPEPEQNTTQPPSTDEARFTQADLDRIARNRAAESARSTENRIAETLGVSLDEAKTIIARQQESERETMSEAQRAKADAEAERTAAASERKAAKAERMAASVERALIRAGVADNLLPKVSRLIDVADDADADAIAEAVAAVKAEVPALFAEVPPPSSPTAPSSAATAKPPTQRPNRDAYGEAVERGKAAAQRSKRELVGFTSPRS